MEDPSVMFVVETNLPAFRLFTNPLSLFVISGCINTNATVLTSTVVLITCGMPVDDVDLVVSLPAGAVSSLTTGVYNPEAAAIIPFVSLLYYLGEETTYFGSSFSFVIDAVDVLSTCDPGGIVANYTLPRSVYDATFRAPDGSASYVDDYTDPGYPYAVRYGEETVDVSAPVEISQGLVENDVFGILLWHSFFYVNVQVGNAISDISIFVPDGACTNSITNRGTHQFTAFFDLVSHSPTPTPTYSLSSTVSTSGTVSVTTTRTFTASPSDSVSTSTSRSTTVSVTATPTFTTSTTTSVTATRTFTTSASDSVSKSVSVSTTVSVTTTPTFTTSATTSATATQTFTTSASDSVSKSVSVSTSVSPTTSVTTTRTTTVSSSPSVTPTFTPSFSPSPSLPPLTFTIDASSDTTGGPGTVLYNINNWRDTFSDAHDSMLVFTTTFSDDVFTVTHSYLNSTIMRNRVTTTGCDVTRFLILTLKSFLVLCGPGVNTGDVTFTIHALQFNSIWTGVQNAENGTFLVQFKPQVFVQTFSANAPPGSLAHTGDTFHVVASFMTVMVDCNLAAISAAFGSYSHADEPIDISNAVAITALTEDPAFEGGDVANHTYLEFDVSPYQVSDAVWLTFPANSCIEATSRRGNVFQMVGIPWEAASVSTSPSPSVSVTTSPSVSVSVTTSPSVTSSMTPSRTSTPAALQVFLTTAYQDSVTIRMLVYFSREVNRDILPSDFITRNCSIPSGGILIEVPFLSYSFYCSSQVVGRTVTVKFRSGVVFGVGDNTRNAESNLVTLRWAPGPVITGHSAYTAPFTYVQAIPLDLQFEWDVDVTNFTHTGVVVEGTPSTYHVAIGSIITSFVDAIGYVSEELNFTTTLSSGYVDRILALVNATDVFVDHVLEQYNAHYDEEAEGIRYMSSLLGLLHQINITHLGTQESLFDAVIAADAAFHNTTLQAGQIAARLEETDTITPSDVLELIASIRTIADISRNSSTLMTEIISAAVDHERVIQVVKSIIDFAETTDLGANWTSPELESLRNESLALALQADTSTNFNSFQTFSWSLTMWLGIVDGEVWQMLTSLRVFYADVVNLNNVMTTRGVTEQPWPLLGTHDDDYDDDDSAPGRRLQLQRRAQVFLTRSATKSKSTTPSASVSESVSPSSTRSASVTNSDAFTQSTSSSGSKSVTVSVSGSSSETTSVSRSRSNSVSGSDSSSVTASSFPSSTVSVSRSGSSSETTSGSRSGSASVSSTYSPSETTSGSWSRTASASSTDSPSETRSGTGSGTPSFSGTRSPSPSRSPNPDWNVVAEVFTDLDRAVVRVKNALMHIAITHTSIVDTVSSLQDVASSLDVSLASNEMSCDGSDFLFTFNTQNTRNLLVSAFNMHSMLPYFTEPISESIADYVSRVSLPLESYASFADSMFSPVSSIFNMMKTFIRLMDTIAAVFIHQSGQSIMDIVTYSPCLQEETRAMMLAQAEMFTAMSGFLSTELLQLGGHLTELSHAMDAVGVALAETEARFFISDFRAIEDSRVYTSQVVFNPRHASAPARILVSVDSGAAVRTATGEATAGRFAAFGLTDMPTPSTSPSPSATPSPQPVCVVTSRDQVHNGVDNVVVYFSCTDDIAINSFELLEASYGTVVSVVRGPDDRTGRTHFTMTVVPSRSVGTNPVTIHGFPDEPMTGLNSRRAITFTYGEVGGHNSLHEYSSAISFAIPYARAATRIESVYRDATHGGGTFPVLVRFSAPVPLFNLRELQVIGGAVFGPAIMITEELTRSGIDLGYPLVPMDLLHRAADTVAPPTNTTWLVFIQPDEAGAYLVQRGVDNPRNRDVLIWAAEGMGTTFMGDNTYGSSESALTRFSFTTHLGIVTVSTLLSADTWTAGTEVNASVVMTLNATRIAASNGTTSLVFSRSADPSMGPVFTCGRMSVKVTAPPSSPAVVAVPSLAPVTTSSPLFSTLLRPCSSVSPHQANWDLANAAAKLAMSRFLRLSSIRSIWLEPEDSSFRLGIEAAPGEDPWATTATADLPLTTTTTLRLRRSDWATATSTCVDDTPTTLSISTGTGWSTGDWQDFGHQTMLRPRSVSTLLLVRPPSPLGRIVLLSDEATRASFRDGGFITQDAHVTEVGTKLVVPMMLWLPCGDAVGAPSGVPPLGNVTLDLYAAMHPVGGSSTAFVGTRDFTTFIDASASFVAQATASAPDLPAYSSIVGVLGERLASLPTTSKLVFKEDECGNHPNARKLVFVSISTTPSDLLGPGGEPLESGRAWFSPLTTSAIAGRTCSKLGSVNSNFSATGGDDDGTALLSSLVWTTFDNEQPRTTFTVVNTFSTEWLDVLTETTLPLPPMDAYFSKPVMSDVAQHMTLSVGVPLVTVNDSAQRVLVVVALGSGIPASAFNSAGGLDISALNSTCATLSPAQYTRLLRARVPFGDANVADVVQVLVGRNTSYPASAAAAAATPTAFAMYPTGSTRVFGHGGLFRVAEHGDDACLAEGGCVVYDLAIPISTALSCMNYDGSHAALLTSQNVDAAVNATSLSIPVTVTWYTASVDRSAEIDATTVTLVQLKQIRRTVAAQVYSHAAGGVVSTWSSALETTRPMLVSLLGATKQPCDAFECNPAFDRASFRCDCGDGVCPPGASFARYALTAQVATARVFGVPDVGIVDTLRPSRPTSSEGDTPYGTPDEWSVQFQETADFNFFRLRFTTECLSEFNITSSMNSRRAFHDASIHHPTSFDSKWSLFSAPPSVPRWADVAAGIALPGAPAVLPGMVSDSLVIHVKAALEAPVLKTTLHGAGREGGIAALAPVKMFPWPTERGGEVSAALVGNETADDVVLVVEINDTDAKAFLSLSIYSVTACAMNEASPYTDCVLFGRARADSQLDCPSPGLAFVCDWLLWNLTVGEEENPVVNVVQLLSAMLPVSSAGATTDHLCRQLPFDNTTVVGSDAFLCPSNRSASYCGHADQANGWQWGQLAGIDGSVPGVNAFRVPRSKLPLGSVAFLVTAVATDCDNVVSEPSPSRRLIQTTSILFSGSAQGDENSTASTHTTGTVVYVVTATPPDNGGVSNGNSEDSPMTIAAISISVFTGTVLLAFAIWAVVFLGASRRSKDVSYSSVPQQANKPLELPALTKRRAVGLSKNQM